MAVRKLPYSLQRGLPAPLLFERSDGRFQLIDRTPVCPFMAGRGHLLVEPAFAGFLREQQVEGRLGVFAPSAAQTPSHPPAA